MTRTPSIALLVLPLLVSAGAAPAQITFQAQTPVVPGVRTLAARDFDRDGEVDPAMAGAPGLAVSYRAAAGATPALVFIPLTGASRATDVVAADMDGDGFDDLICLADASLHVAINDRTRGWTAVWSSSVAVTQPPDRRSGLAAADVDGDGDTDVVVTSDELLGHPSTLLTSIYLNQGNGTLASPALVAGGAHVPRAADVDGDGDVDVLALSIVQPGGGVAPAITVLENDGTGTFTRSATIPIGQGAIEHFVVRDFDCDGDPDLAVLSRPAGSPAAVVTGHANDGQGAFSLASGPDPAGSGVGWAGDAADFDRDGDLDVVLLTNDGLIQVLENLRPAPGFAAPVAFSSGLSAVAGAEGPPQGIAAGDFDSDGNLDLVVAQESGLASEINLLRNTAPADDGPYLGPLAAGNVGAGAGGPFDVYSINGSYGGASRRVDEGIGQPVTLVMDVAPGAGPSHFLIFGFIGVPTCEDETPITGAGTMVFPPCPLAPAHSGLFFGASSVGAIGGCTPLIYAQPAPWWFTTPGSPGPLTVTIQGLLVEPPGILRITNAVILHIT